MRIIPNLWFDGDAEEAAEFYTSIFPNSRVTNVVRYTEAGPGEPGSVVTVEFSLDGQPFVGINGGPMFSFTPAVSFAVPCASQDEADRCWDALLAGGGKAVQCGWLEDRFGLSWQVFPAELIDLLSDADPRRASAAARAMQTMVRIDVAAIRAAADAASAG